MPPIIAPTLLPRSNQEGPLTHLDSTGAAHMVDVGDKPVTTRRAIATGRIDMTPAALIAIRDGTAKKGDVIAVARIAGIMAAKRTADLIPLCHPLPLTKVTLDLTLDDEGDGAGPGTGITATATTATDGKTGVEMEALTAVSIALLTIYDMAKALDKTMTIGGITLLEKTGGKSGDWHASPST